jgi:F0F1-type ATP synthase membrane subunit b/b'
MFSFVLNLFLLLAESESAFSRFMHWWHLNADPILNYPGFEVWKFLNLAIFVYVLYRLAKAPVGEAFKARRDAIRAELIKAEEEKQVALAKMSETESKLAALPAEKSQLLENARKESEAEKLRIAAEAKNETAKLREQSANEIARLIQQSKIDLRNFSAEESIRRAEDLIRSSMNEETDSRLVKAAVQTLGGTR